MKVNPIDVQKHLKGVGYPADRDELVRVAERNGAGDDLMQALRGLGRSEFSGPDDVMEELGRSS
jgi:Protein of unknown function (DUF2795)